MTSLFTVVCVFICVQLGSISVSALSASDSNGENLIRRPLVQRSLSSAVLSLDRVLSKSSEDSELTAGPGLHILATTKTTTTTTTTASASTATSTTTATASTSTTAAPTTTTTVTTTPALTVPVDACQVWGCPSYNTNCTTNTTGPAGYSSAYCEVQYVQVVYNLKFNVTSNIITSETAAELLAAVYKLSGYSIYSWTANIGNYSWVNGTGANKGTSMLYVLVDITCKSCGFETLSAAITTMTASVSVSSFTLANATILSVSTCTAAQSKNDTCQTDLNVVAATTTTSTSSDSSSTINLAVLIGAVAGGGAALIIIICISVYCYRLHLASNSFVIRDYAKNIKSTGNAVVAFSNPQPPGGHASSIASTPQSRSASGTYHEVQQLSLNPVYDPRQQQSAVMTVSAVPIQHSSYGCPPYASEVNAPPPPPKRTYSGPGSAVHSKSMNDRNAQRISPQQGDADGEAEGGVLSIDMSFQ